ncbi:hypothetical protein PDIG_79690 [Penicillium digitatum PHI26]|uniref:Uncharacterized protein n=2 Tax=Penicillium digitatum TaxID=36651 RepID=K9FYR7_PEND2|nr:hypothetical protein PDIP_28070 [Penicillium digitatum Pd1]EKV06191.1 hypothetical protein PDIG_79690 [Penicillium digitatum PHI26]EKV18259.1 hypothetical protein PDIP_28070 [Penicillium digitatum Pd1]
MQRNNSLLSQIPRNGSQARKFCKQFDEAQAKTNRYFERCKTTLDAEGGGRLEDMEQEL